MLILTTFLAIRLKNYKNCIETAAEHSELILNKKIRWCKQHWNLHNVHWCTLKIFQNISSGKLNTISMVKLWFEMQKCNIFVYNLNILCFHKVISKFAILWLYMSNNSHPTKKFIYFIQNQLNLVNSFFCFLKLCHFFLKHSLTWNTWEAYLERSVASLRLYDNSFKKAWLSGGTKSWALEYKIYNEHVHYRQIYTVAHLP